MRFKLAAILIVFVLFGLSLGAHAGESVAECPNGAFARELVSKSNDRFGVRCYKAGGTQANKDEFWTRKFIQLDSNGSVQGLQGASCPKDRFVDSVVFNNTHHFIAIRCRYVQTQSSRGTWSEEYWSRKFMSPDSSQIDWAQCPGNSVISEIIPKKGGFYIRCRNVVVNGAPLDFLDDYWTRYFAYRKK